MNRMDDLISRQAVLDKLKRLIEVERLQGTDEMGYGRERVSAYETMIHSIKSEYLYPSVSVAEKAGEWIPVSEMLPEDGIYLVTVERITGKPRIETKSFAKDLNRVDDFSFRKHKCGWYDYDSEYGCWEDTNVIAWMPLPQPYNGESEDKG